MESKEDNKEAKTNMIFDMTGTTEMEDNISMGIKEENPTSQDPQNKMIIDCNSPVAEQKKGAHTTTRR